MTKIYKDANHQHISCTIAYVNDGKIYSDQDHNNQMTKSDLKSAYEQNLLIDIDGKLFKTLSYYEEENVGAVTYGSVDLMPGKNILDPSKLTFSETGAKYGSKSDPIVLKPGTYTVSCKKTVDMIHFWTKLVDGGIVYIDQSLENTNSLTTTLSKEVYVYISFSKAGLTSADEFQLEEGSSKTPFAPYSLSYHMEINSAVSKPND